jgi:predicted nucleotidyltransferase
MKVELSNDAVDQIFRSVLVQDYKMLKEDIKRLKEKKDNLANYQKEDLKANKRYKKAMEIMLEYYVGIDWEQSLYDYDTTTNIPEE